MSDLKWTYEQCAMYADRANRRLIAVIILLVCVLLASNGAWLYYESQFESEITTTSIKAEQQADGDSNNYVIGGNYGGETKSISDDDH